MTKYLSSKYLLITKYLITIMLALFTCSASLAAEVKEDKSCNLIRFANPGWSDVTMTTAAASYILEALNYKTKELFVSVPITYSALSSGELDVFLGYWTPSMTSIYQPYKDNGSVELLHTNLEGARYGLAVPKYLYDEGLKSVQDLVKFSKELNYNIYGVEAGNDGNTLILNMIKDDAFGLKNFSLIESSEQAMLAQVDVQTKQKQPIVFLAWEPHPMNINHEIRYLEGADEYFGKNQGEAKVHTNVRKNFANLCPNVAKFLSQLTFTTEMENEWMDQMINKKKNPQKVVISWLKNNPQTLEKWLENVYTKQGLDAVVAVKQKLKII